LARPRSASGGPPFGPGPGVLCGLFLLASLASQAWGGGAEGGGVTWAADLESALEEAQVEGRIVMVDFYATWCGWCKKLDRETYADPRVVGRLANLVAVKVDGERRRDVAKEYGVGAYPTIGFLTAAGRPIQLVRGYQPPDAFVALLDRLLDRKADEFVLRERLKDHPELADVRADLALLLLARGESGEALSHLDTLLSKKEELPPDLYWEFTLARGKALLAAGDARGARRSLEDYVKHRKESPRLGEALFFLAEAAYAGGDRKAARKYYRKSLDIRPEGWLAGRSRERLAGLG
jgi:thioredoxin-related protein